MPKVKDLGVTVVPEQFGPVEIGPGGACNPTQFCTDCTMQQFSICGTTPGPRAGGGGCSDCTMQQFSICGTTPGPGCTDCTYQPFSICGTSPGPIFCTDCTYQPFSICGTTPGPGACRPRSMWTPCGGGSWQWQGGGGLTPEAIAQMKQQLQAQIAALEEAEKAAIPKTLAAIESREQELQAELARLSSAKTELKKKK